MTRQYIKQKLCISCEKWLRYIDGITDDDDDYTYIEGGINDGKPICNKCYYSDNEDPTTTITIHYTRGKELYEDYDLIWFGYYTIQSTDTEYQYDWTEEHHYSGYRGYTDIKSDKWKEIGFINVRQFDESQERLEKPYTALLDRLIEHDIIYATAQSVTSNCMVVNLTLWVQNKDIDNALKIKEQIIKDFNLNEDDF